MRFIVEDWLTEDVIKVFPSEETRQAWIDDNCVTFSDGTFIDDTSIRISIYEEYEI